MCEALPSAPWVGYVPLLAALWSAIPVRRCLGAEMAFVEVTPADEISIRTLDAAARPMVGVQGLFASDPMVSHDWASMEVLRRALGAEIAASEQFPASPAAARQRQMEDRLRPLFAALPKNAQGRLDNATARYALHRHFARAYGWSVKGLEPAGAAWVKVMGVSAAVHQITKYILPAVIHQRILEHAGHDRGLDLRWLAMWAATIEHLTHGEVLEYLAAVYQNLELAAGAARSSAEVEEIVTFFLAEYAFGTDFEVSSAADVRRTVRHLDGHHQGWRELRDFALDLLEGVQPPPRDFGSIAAFLEDLMQRYASWQERDCRRARSLLRAAPGASPGLVLYETLEAVGEAGRRELFREDQEYLLRLGALANTSRGDPAVIAPNYLLSQAMCLTTASFHKVCCHNECDDLLEQVELAVRSPSAPAAAVAAALAPALAERGGEGLASELEGVARRDGGEVRLHGSGFAEWLHRAFPWECPTPGGRSHTNPKTASEWMADPGNDTIDTEELMLEIADVLSRYTTLGAEDPEQEGSGTAQDLQRPLEVVVDYPIGRDALPHVGPRWLCLRSVFQSLSLAAMAWLACSMGRSAFLAAAAALDATRPSAPKRAAAPPEEHSIA